MSDSNLSGVEAPPPSSPLVSAPLPSRSRTEEGPGAATPGTPARIEAKNVDFYYGRNQALSEVTMRIVERAVTALIGPSGCGKSTFLRCLNRMNDIISDTRVEGKILLDGEDIYAPGTDVVALRRRVGMVFQKSNPFPKSIFDNVAYGLRINGSPRATELADRVEVALRGPPSGTR